MTFKLSFFLFCQPVLCVHKVLPYFGMFLLYLACLRHDSENEGTWHDTEQLIQRFRANLVISGQEAYAEDDWSHLTVGDTQFQVRGNSWHIIISWNWNRCSGLFLMFWLRWLGDVAAVRWLELIKNQPLEPRNPFGLFLNAEVERSVKTEFIRVFFIWLLLQENRNDISSIWIMNYITSLFSSALCS